MSDKPLWMPIGSVRAIITLLIIGALVAAILIGVNAVIAGKIEPEPLITVLAPLTTLAAAVSLYYFEHRRNGD